MKLLTVPEVADALRKSQRFVRDELTRKNLRGYRLGGAWHVDAADLESYIEAHANAPRVKGRAS